jgi:ATP-dependent helicase/nuclease subunit A
VRQVTASGQSLAEAAAALEADCNAPGDVESLPLEPGHSDLVRVMNLHKAKGLEASVVFLADPCGGPWQRVSVTVSRDGASARGYFCIKRKNGEFGEKAIAAPAGWAQHEADEQIYLAAEEQRLLYVAGTRARDKLVVGRWARGAGRSTPAWGAFEPFLTGAPELAVPATASAPAAQKVDLSAGANTRAFIARVAAHKRVREASWSATSVTAEARHIAKMARSVEGEADDPTRALIGGTPSHGADAGMAWGTLIHGLLEHAMRHKGASQADLTRLAMWLTFEQPEIRPVVDEAVRTVENFTRSEFWQLASTSDHAVEVPFLFAESANSLLAGVIDLVFRSEESWEVVDYKTDVDLSEDRAAQRYAHQLAAYQRALASCGVPNSMASIRSVRASNDVAETMVPR